MTTGPLFIDPDRRLAGHLVRALLLYRGRCVEDGIAMPGELVALLTSCRKRVSAGHSGSPLDGSAACLDSEVMPGPTPAPRLVTLSTAAQMLAVSQSTVKRLVARGQLVPVRVAGAPRLRVSDLDAYLDRLGSPAAPAPGEPAAASASRTDVAAPVSSGAPS